MLMGIKLREAEEKVKKRGPCRRTCRRYDRE